jgi:hypothetical protein
MRKRSLTLRTRRFSPHLLSRVVRSEPDIDFVHRLAQMRGPDESYSDVVIRLAKASP